MKDALGAVESVLVLGGGSDIALATLEKLVASRTRNVVLAGRVPGELKQAAGTLEKAGAAKVETVVFDANEFASHAEFVKTQFEKHGGFDLVLLTFGILGDQKSDEQNPLDAVKVIETNFTGAVSVLLSVSDEMKKQGHGTIAVLSSVAAVRARSANFIYGSSKAGLDAFCQGLGDSLVGTGVSVMVVRPGFVTTKMTAGMETKPMSTSAEEVAEEIVDGLGRNSEIVRAPAKLQFVFLVIRNLPRSIFRKIKQ